MDCELETVCAGLLLSVTVSENANVPEVVGTPETMPVPAARINPGGRSPEEIDHA
jgi:hypothetical protein